ncbi:hypothetical protein AZE42_04268 [Rhizopogon vesiculosus]|uniref:Uncharacterized protein n=1 Tax=Rhizopogon vesiculosus TaxID=180088 RepID=A0A1J8QMT5_9AGAM|nr:hypothetical protein AZE42_04268 [Rhizopogon vesiculosus]
MLPLMLPLPVPPSASTHASGSTPASASTHTSGSTFASASTHASGSTFASASTHASGSTSASTSAPALCPSLLLPASQKSHFRFCLCYHPELTSLNPDPTSYDHSSTYSESQISDFILLQLNQRLRRLPFPPHLPIANDLNKSSCIRTGNLFRAVQHQPDYMPALSVSAVSHTTSTSAKASSYGITKPLRPVEGVRLEGRLVNSQGLQLR